MASVPRQVSADCVDAELLSMSQLRPSVSAVNGKAPWKLRGHLSCVPAYSRRVITEAMHGDWRMNDCAARAPGTAEEAAAANLTQVQLRLRWVLRDAAGDAVLSGAQPLSAFEEIEIFETIDLAELGGDPFQARLAQGDTVIPHCHRLSLAVLP